MSEFFPLLVEIQGTGLPIPKSELYSIVNNLYPNIKALCNSAIEKYTLTNPFFLLKLYKLGDKYLWDLFIIENGTLAWIGGER
jgi:hypothetical protein